MANFIVLIDPDAERRERFAATVKPRLAYDAGLQAGDARHGAFFVAWETCSHAPVDLHTQEDGVAVLFGRAAKADNGGRITAADLMHMDAESADVYDGFHAAISWRDDRGFLAGVDFAGSFPLYYFSTGEIFLCGSSSELFRHHPCFRARLDPEGLVGILLMEYLMDDLTQLRGVRRVARGCVLSWKPGQAVREIPRCHLPGPAPANVPPAAEQSEAYALVLKRAIDALAPKDRPWAAMLSGGQDSRLIAGEMSEAGRDLIAVSIGRESDLDVRCGSLVAKSLHVPHHRLDIANDEYARVAQRKARWEHLASGFSDVEFEAASAHLRQFQSDIVTGLFMDSTYAHLLYLSEPTPPVISFEREFAYMNRWALSPAQLNRLLRPEIFGSAVDSVTAKARKLYESASDDEVHRVRCFEQHGRQRFHIACNLWQWSFGGWPFSPALTRAHTDFLFRQPYEFHDPRGHTRALLCKRFPALARLPIDRNKFDTTALLGPGWPRLGRWLPWLREPVINDITSVQQLRYHRVYDFNSPGWRAIRRAAEPHRARLYDWFVPEVVNELLPRPDATPVFKRLIPDAGGLKLLVGLMLWLGDDREVAI